MSSTNEVLIREATPKDSSRLNDFFFSVPIQGKLEIKIRRQSDFFSFYERLNYQFKTMILENVSAKSNEKKDSESSTLGTATFIFQRRFLKTFESKFAFACDLRISPTRQAILNWGQHFTPQLEKLRTEQKVEHIITSINLSDSQLVNTFLRPRARKGLRPLYELISKYSLVSVHGYYPFSKPKNENVFIERCTSIDRPALIAYLRKRFLEVELVPSEFLNDFERTIQGSLIYMWSQFIIAKDPTGKIVGCVYPIASTLLQDYFPQNYNSRSNNFRQFLKLASLLRFGRKLTKPFSSTQKDDTLNFRLLHFFFFDHPEVMKSLLWGAYADSKQNEFVVYAYQEGQFAYRPPHGTISVAHPYALYEIKHPDPRINADPSLKKKTGFPIFLDHFWF